METISLNGKWTCKSDLENLGIDSKWFIPKNYDRNDNRFLVKKGEFKKGSKL